MSDLKVYYSGNALSIGGQTMPINSGVTAVASTETGYTDYIMISSEEETPLIIAQYDEIFKSDGTTTYGATVGAAVTALNALFTDENPDRVVKQTDTILSLDGVEQFTTGKAGEFLAVGSSKDGAIVASGVKATDLLYPNTAISTSGITNTGAISSTGAITTDSFMRADYLILEGSTEDEHETTLTLVDPTQDNTITLPNASGTVALTSDIPNLSGYVDTTGTIAAGYIPIFADSNTLQGSAAFQIFNGVIVSTYNMGVADLSVSSLVLSSAGTPSITVNTGEDLNITSKGFVTIQLDSDNNETNQKFRINDPSTTERFSVTDTGVVSINSEYSLPNTDGSSGQVLSTDGNGTVTWVDQGTDAEIGQAYKTTSQTLSTTPAAITSWTTETQDDLSIFDPTTGALTITQAGKYLIAFEADFDMSVFVDRENPFAYIEKDGTEISGSRRHSYQRSVGSGEASVALTMVYEHTTGTAVFKAVVGAEIGSSTTSLVSASMSYSTLGGAQGPQGVSGDAFAVSTEAAGRTLVAGDHLKYLRSTSATAVTFTVPPQSSASWVDNAEIVFEQAGVGQITIAAGSGVTINSSETLKSSTQYSVIALKRVASDTWTLTGERELL